MTSRHAISDRRSAGVALRFHLPDDRVPNG